VNKVVYISDAFLCDIVGGGELNDHELCLELQKNKIKVIKKRSSTLSIEDIDVELFYIISNFMMIKEDVKNYITKNCNYIIYEHDHKYLKSRNPALYKEYRAPEDLIINKEFYQRSKLVFCQTSFHESIIRKNLNIKNLYNVSGNLWSTDSLNMIKDLSSKDKKDRYSILNSKIAHKNTRETIFYCETKGYDYDLVSSKKYKNFLSLLSNNDKFIFLPKTPETLSRVVVEAKMMNMKVITNKRVGASYEPWFTKKGIELIEIMSLKREAILDKVMETING
tara:strand:+ start:206 stop:1045 length:840 start_codon:yes stop_codon:yes gene_type:complete